jgi:hypothetical protein
LELGAKVNIGLVMGSLLNLKRKSTMTCPFPWQKEQIGENIRRKNSYIEKKVKP